MKLLSSIKINEDVEFEYSRDNQKNNFEIISKKSKERVRNRNQKTGSFGRRIGADYIQKVVTRKSFMIFKKDFQLDLRDITVIIGKNGIGKTSLVNMIKFPTIKSFDLWDFNGEKTEDELRDEIVKNYISNSRRTLNFVGSPTYIVLDKHIHKSEFQNELGNKISGGNYSKDEFLSFFHVSSSSNGENVLDYFNTLSKLENAIIVLDEPETSLSLDSLLLIRKIIKKLSKKNQIILITHSPLLMSLDDKLFDFEKKEYIDSKDKVLEYIHKCEEFL